MRQSILFLSVKILAFSFAVWYNNHLKKQQKEDCLDH